MFRSTLVFLPLAIQGAFGAALELRADCSDVHIFVTRGNDEPYPGRQGALTDAICENFSSCAAEHIEYDNPASPACDALTKGPQLAISQITAFHQRCPNSKIILTGYSQGGQTMGDILGGGGGQFWDCVEPTNAGFDPNSGVGSMIVAALLWGDARHTAGQSYNVLSGSGKNGYFPRSGEQLAGLNRWADRLRSYCVDTDPICARGNDGHTHETYFDLNDADAAKWVKQKVAAFKPPVAASSSAVVASSSSSAAASSSSASASSSGSASVSSSATASASVSSTGSSTAIATDSASASGSSSASGSAAVSTGSADSTAAASGSASGSAAASASSSASSSGDLDVEAADVSSSASSASATGAAAGSGTTLITSVATLESATATSALPFQSTAVGYSYFYPVMATNTVPAGTTYSTAPSSTPAPVISYVAAVTTASAGPTGSVHTSGNATVSSSQPVPTTFNGGAVSAKQLPALLIAVAFGVIAAL